MLVLTFNDEFSCPVAPHRLFHGLFMDAQNLMPKIMPVVKSIDFVSGDGGPGSVQQVNFADGYQMKYLKKRLDFNDKENCAKGVVSLGLWISNEISEEQVGLQGQRELCKRSSEVKFDAAPGGGSRCTIKTIVCPKGDVVPDEETLNAGKEGHMQQYKAVIAHLIENPHLYA